MWKYVVKRLLLGALTVLAITFVVYALLWALPEKPYAQLLARPNLSDADRLNIIHRFGADKPFLYQYWIFLTNFLKPFWSWWGWPPHGPSPPDLGDSVTFHDTVAHLMSLRLPNTAILMGTAYVVTLVIAIPVGIISAVRQYSKLDNFVTSASFFGISLPNFWFGSILIYAFAIFPHSHGFATIFPAGGIHTTGLEFGQHPLDLAWHLVLPVIVLAVQSIAVHARYMRSAMLEILNQDYIRTARAKGLAERRVIGRHAVRNSLLPLITLMGLDIPVLFVGAVVTEVVFSWPGMGLLFDNAAESNDYATLMGIVLLLSVFVVIGNLIADIAYTWADPRISYETSR